MEALFIPAPTAASKSNRGKLSGGILCYEIKAASLHTFVHSVEGGVIVHGLACDIAKSLS
jgi:hypothetical protein